MEIEDSDPDIKEFPATVTQEPKNSDAKYRKNVFFIMVLINVLLNYDTGVIPASLKELQSEMSLSYQQSAAVGSILYIGICCSSLIVSVVFQRYTASKVIICMMIINCFFCLLFSFSFSPISMYIARLGMGFTQAFCVIYAPVWTNEFAPHEKCTRWMGILQCAVPLGVVLGYGTASLFSAISVDFFDWRFAIQLQAVLEIPLIVALSTIDGKYIDIIHPELVVSSGQKSPRGTEAEVRMDVISITNLPGFFQQLRMLAGNSIFIFLTLALCCLFFVVSGIQYWVTLYMIETLKANQIVVIIGFMIISTTAPIIGVLSGGYIADYYGGYKGKNIKTAVTICTVFGFLAFLVSIPAGLVQSVIGEIVLLWLLLFCGGCIVPSATGITVNSMPKELQSSSSSISQLVFNFGGFFLSPILSAAVMDQFTDRNTALTWGFRFTLSFSLIGLIFISFAYLSIVKDHQFYVLQTENSMQVEEVKEKMQEIARRVKPIVVG